VDIWAGTIKCFSWGPSWLASLQLLNAEIQFIGPGSCRNQIVANTLILLVYGSCKVQTLHNTDPQEEHSCCEAAGLGRNCPSSAMRVAIGVRIGVPTNSVSVRVRAHKRVR